MYHHDQLPHGSSSLNTVTEVYNSSNVFSGEEQRMAFTVREPIVRGTAQDILQSINQHVYCCHFLLLMGRNICSMYDKGRCSKVSVYCSTQCILILSCPAPLYPLLPCSSLSSFSVRSCSWNASLVVDGQFHYNFPWGEHLTCTLHAEDILRTVNIQTSHKHTI